MERQISAITFLVQKQNCRTSSHSSCAEVEIRVSVYSMCRSGTAELQVIVDKLYVWKRNTAELKPQNIQ